MSAVGPLFPQLHGVLRMIWRWKPARQCPLRLGWAEILHFFWGWGNWTKDTADFIRIFCWCGWCSFQDVSGQFPWPHRFFWLDDVRFRSHSSTPSVFHGSTCFQGNGQHILGAFHTCLGRCGRCGHQRRCLNMGSAYPNGFFLGGCFLDATAVRTDILGE